MEEMSAKHDPAEKIWEKGGSSNQAQEDERAGSRY